MEEKVFASDMLNKADHCMVRVIVPAAIATIPNIVGGLLEQLYL
jgi:hypothetical protein